MNSEWELEMVEALAVIFTDLGVGTYSPSTPTTAEPLLTLMNVPSSPNQLVTLSIYGQVEQHVSIAIGTMSLQVRTRSRPNMWRDCAKAASKVFEFLQGKEGLMLGSIHCPSIERSSFAWLGQDTSQRWERTDNYNIMVDLPATANRE